MTLDGYGEFPNYPGSDVVTEKPDEAFTDTWISRYDSADTVVFGRHSFEGHLNVHSEAVRKPTNPKYLLEFSRWLDRCQKIVLSRHLTKTKWQNSTIMNGELGWIVAK